MFRGLINDAKFAVGSAVAHYATRAAVAGVFVLALGFATAAVAGWLSQRFGAINACWILAAGFSVVGLVAATIVGWQESRITRQESAAVGEDTATVATEAAAQAAAQVPIALLGSILTTPLGPSTVAALARFVGRNLSLFIFLGIIALLFWPSSASEAEEETGPQRADPAGSQV